MRSVVTAATSTVAVTSSPWSSLWPNLSFAEPRMIGFSTMMYAMAKNVASPPRSSCVTDEPRREMWK